MNKEKIIIGIMALSLLTVAVFTGCSSNTKQIYSYTDKGDESDMPEKEDIIIEDKDGTYNIGDEIEVSTVEFGTDREYLEKCYTINCAKIYDTASQIDGVQDKLFEMDYYMGANPEQPKVMKIEDTAQGRFLYCDITIKNVEDSTCTIGDLDLVYEVDGVCQLVGYPVYFSASKNEEHGAFEYNLLQGQSMDAKIGWCVDSDLLQIKNMDVSKLFLAVNFSGEEEDRQFINLGLE